MSQVPVPARVVGLLIAVMSWALVLGCGTRYGDTCTTDSECGGRNTCDLAAVPDGYCTRTPCRSIGCGDDEDAICVVFTNQESFCMLGCEDSDDCRSGHLCLAATSGDKYCYVQ